MCEVCTQECGCERERFSTGEMVSGAETCMFGVDWQVEMGKHNLFEDGMDQYNSGAPIVRFGLSKKGESIVGSS